MYPKTFFGQKKINERTGSCFVLMPFARDFMEVYDAISRAIEGQELDRTCYRADEIFGGGHVIEDILANIAEAELIIADVTSRNPNVFYELGIAHMVKDVRNVIIITQAMADVPFDLQQF